jgi:predicted RNA-binding Zn-ribbon protein involved in translation (DUF1610 family)
MGVIKKKGSTLFRCDTPMCGEWHIEHHGSSWDEVRMATPRATDAGWYVSTRSGRLEAFCPACAAPIGYKLGPDGLP